jgi:hypothetical protein
LGQNIAHALGQAALHAIQDGSTRLTSVLDGSDPHDAHYGEGFPKGSAAARKAMKRARKAQTETGHFKKGSDAAYKKMEELREMRGGAIRGPNPWLEHVKAFRGRNPELTYKECLSAAAAEYRR